MDRYELTAQQWSRLGHEGSDVVERPAASALADLVDGDGDGERSAESLIDAHLPLAELLAALADQERDRQDEMGRLFALPNRLPPFVVGVTGGVAAGKTVTAKVLEAILTATGEMRVAVVSTDGFLFSNRELETRGLTDRKGFPESYDHAGLITFLSAVKAGQRQLAAPMYDHVHYDVGADGEQTLPRPDILILEGINVLQPAPAGEGPTADGGGLLVSDFVDFSIYVDADEPDIRTWFLRRLQNLRARSAGDPTSFFAGFESFTDAEFLAMGEAVWQAVNRPNLEHHIAPTRPRADLIMEKAADHSVRRVLVRRG
jgi:type I pantothenate kinase